MDRDPTSRKRLTYDDPILNIHDPKEKQLSNVLAIEGIVEEKDSANLNVVLTAETPGKVQDQKRSKRSEDETNTKISAASNEEADRTQ